jgi:hypothetical protein
MLDRNLNLTVVRWDTFESAMESLNNKNKLNNLTGEKGRTTFSANMGIIKSLGKSLYKLY